MSIELRLALISRLCLIVLFALAGLSCGREDSDKPAAEIPSPDSAESPPESTNSEENDASKLKPSLAEGGGSEEDDTREDEVQADTSGTGSADGIVVDPTLPAGFKNLDELNEVDPEKQSLMIFDGSKPVTREACSVYIVAEAKDGSGNPRYYVRSTLTHGTVTHSYLVLDLKDRAATKIDGIGSNHLSGNLDLATFVLAEPGRIESSTRVNIKWWHTDHWHVFSCEKLKPRQ
jgi:hypothetical protein